jgi:hypothetical protein
MVGQLGQFFGHSIVYGNIEEIFYSFRAASG